MNYSISLGNENMACVIQRTEQLDRHDSDSLITIRTPTEGRKVM